MDTELDVLRAALERVAERGLGEAASRDVVMLWAQQVLMDADVAATLSLRQCQACGAEVDMGKDGNG